MAAITDRFDELALGIDGLIVVGLSTLSIAVGNLAPIQFGWADGWVNLASLLFLAVVVAAANDGVCVLAMVSLAVTGRTALADADTCCWLFGFITGNFDSPSTLLPFTN